LKQTKQLERVKQKETKGKPTSEEATKLFQKSYITHIKYNIYDRKTKIKYNMALFFYIMCYGDYSKIAINVYHVCHPVYSKHVKIT
jgi:hypothetical protein